MRTLLPILSVIVFSMGACRGGEPQTRSTPGGTSVPGADNFLELPPVDRSCARDDDCVFGAAATREGVSCCLGCPSTPVARAWHRLLLEKCEAWNADKAPLTCPKVKCRERRPVACVDKQCVNKFIYK